MPVAEAQRDPRGEPPTLSSHLQPHPTAALLQAALRSHPAHASELFSTFNDLAYSARWTHLEPVQLLVDSHLPQHKSSGQRVNRPALIGWKKDEKKATLIVCLRYNEQITPFLLASIFSTLHTLPNPYTFQAPPHGPTLLLPTTSTSSQSDESTGQQNAEEAPTAAAPFPSVPVQTDAVTVAVLGTDGAVVYYNLAEGIRKPIN